MATKPPSKVDMVTKHYLSIIERNGFMIQAVEGATAYETLAYTIGLTDKGRMDVFVRAPGPGVAWLLDKVARENNKKMDVVLEEPELAVKILDISVPLRYRLVQVPAASVAHLLIGCYNTRLVKKEPEFFIEIQIGDPGNLLPGEEGYVPFDQYGDGLPADK